MSCFTNRVTVERRCRHYGGQFTVLDSDQVKQSAECLLRIVEDGTAVVMLDSRGWQFRDDACKNNFIQEVESFINSHPHAPDNFSDDDREQIRQFVEELLCKYLKEERIILSAMGS